jgi:hypothetical protein
MYIASQRYQSMFDFAEGGGGEGRMGVAAKRQDTNCEELDTHAHAIKME